MGFDLSSLTGGIYDFLGGTSVPRADVSGAFPGLGKLGGELQKYLLQRLKTPAAQSEQFKLGSNAIRDSLGAVAGASRQRLGDAAITGGFADSGAVLRGMSDIDRSEAAAFSSSIRELLLGLEDRRMEGVLPFLSGGANERLGVAQANIGASLGERGQNLNFLSSMLTGKTEGSNMEALLALLM